MDKQRILDIGGRVLWQLKRDYGENLSKEVLDCLPTMIRIEMEIEDSFIASNRQAAMTVNPLPA